MDDKWKKYFEIWAQQGRTKEQQWAVENFMTGQGALMIEQVRQQTAREIWEIVDKEVSVFDYTEDADTANYLRDHIHAAVRGYSTPTETEKNAEDEKTPPGEEYW